MLNLSDTENLIFMELIEKDITDIKNKTNCKAAAVDERRDNNNNAKKIFSDIVKKMYQSHTKM